MGCRGDVSGDRVGLTASRQTKRPSVKAALSEYRLFETSTFQRDLDRLGSAAARQIRNTLEERVYPVLRANPRQVPSAARLREWEPPSWRLRIGSWRIFYEIKDDSRVAR
jgi:mRNA interferase RelE/StbE